jgi:hypothetical protein
MGQVVAGQVVAGQFVAGQVAVVPYWSITSVNMNNANIFAGS